MLSGSVHGALERAVVLGGLLRDRARAQLLRLRGARLGGKVRVGPRVEVRRPWRVALGRRAHLEPAVRLKLVADEASVRLGDYVFLGSGTVLDVRLSVEIGDHTVIAPGCLITDHNHGLDAATRIDQQDCPTAPVHIGADVWIGANAVILAGTNVSDGAVVGANAVVNRDVAPYEIVGGVPARRIGTRRGLDADAGDESGRFAVRAGGEAR